MLGPAGHLDFDAGVASYVVNPSRQSHRIEDVALDYLARHAIDFWLTTEDLPYPSNRITVDRGVCVLEVNGQILNEAVVLNGTTPVALTKTRIIKTASEIVVTHTSGTPTYVAGTDYVMAYGGTSVGETGGNPTIARVGGGAISDGQTVHVDYKWTDPNYDNYAEFHPVADTLGQMERAGANVDDLIYRNSSQGGTGSRAAFLAATFAVLPLLPATAAPDATVASGDDWEVSVAPGGYEVTVELDRNPMPAGEPTWVTTTVRNLGSDDIIWAHDGCATAVHLQGEVAIPPWRTGQQQRGFAGILKREALGVRNRVEGTALVRFLRPEHATMGEFACADAQWTKRIEPGGAVSLALTAAAGVQRVTPHGSPAGPWRRALRLYAFTAVSLAPGCSLQLELEGEDSAAGSDLATRERWRYGAVGVSFRWAL